MRRIAILAAVVVGVTWVAPVRANTLPPLWAPVAGVIAPVGVATGGAMCSHALLHLEPQETTISYTTQTTGGAVIVVYDAACATAEPGITLDVVIGLYQQKATGGILDPITLVPWQRNPVEGTGPRSALGALTLLDSYHCPMLNPAQPPAQCRSKRMYFRNTPGTRIVAIAFAAYALVDPRGGAWFENHPFCDVSASSWMKLRCIVAAELRS